MKIGLELLLAIEDGEARSQRVHHLLAVKHDRRHPRRGGGGPVDQGGRVGALIGGDGAGEREQTGPLMRVVFHQALQLRQFDGELGAAGQERLEERALVGEEIAAQARLDVDHRVFGRYRQQPDFGGATTLRALLQQGIEVEDEHTEYAGDDHQDHGESDGHRSAEIQPRGGCLALGTALSRCVRDCAHRLSAYERRERALEWALIESIRSSISWCGETPLRQ